MERKGSENYAEPHYNPQNYDDFDAELIKARNRRLLYAASGMVGIVGVSALLYNCASLINSGNDGPPKPKIPESKIVAGQPVQVEKRYTTTPCVSYIRVGVCGRREKQYNLKVEQCPENSSISPDAIIGTAATGCYFGAIVVNEQTYNLRTPGEVFTPTEVRPVK